MSVVVLLLRLFGSSPVEANAIAAGDDMRLRITLDRIALRECRGRPCGVHEADAWASDAAYRNAVRAGWLDPDGCVFHRDRTAIWSTRGAHGLFAAYHLRFLPIPCLPPWVLDIPIVSAFAAAAKARDLCERRGACSYRSTVTWWASGRGPV